MKLYRASPKDGPAWVTGASTGIGRALALELARKGYVVAATARREALLTELAREAEGLAGRILPCPADVTDSAAMAGRVEQIERDHGPLALAIFNAGDYFPTRGEALSTEEFIATYQVNLFGVVHGLVPAVERMKAHGRGHVAVIGSASAYGGLPRAAAYGASKAALNNMAAALKFDFDLLNIRIQVFNPGFVDTPLTKTNRFAMPALMTPEAAAKRMLAGLETGGFEISFPRRFTWAIKLVNILPYPAYFALVKRFTGWHRRNLHQ
ncbi:SDR family NAD(P)-dependent oxidoreductase [Nitratireductor mangrovi]|uniref:SDR family NAD(P)-dependent oxidoreductase n=1 Tax=Nitratireductor mangrovi TaxID=2599600 RepID=A0A5B8KVU7_9HYPH|nr:SDR family NAD(P)-dependent oxidoreductase [Nitratireductor mangrovi]QDY99675.1 SDR family NAD(P)-dependent oxidoreductase [Nitratireductor mangrovi]